jgi:uncharacterized protein YneF (UPF0154 family)
MKSRFDQIIEYLIFLLLGILIGITINHKRIPEDVDNNGKVNSKDLWLVKKYLIKEEK